MMQGKLKSFMLVLSVLLITACAATSTRESTTQYLDSTAITTKVKARLVDRLGTDSLAIKVKTYKDEVQLSGFVNSMQIKQRAGVIASKTHGVKRVRNDLIIKTRR